MIAGCTEKSITLTFERSLTRSVPDEETRVLEPAAEVRFFGLPLRMSETRERCNAMLHERRMTNEYHGRRTGTTMDQADVSDALKLMLEFFPLSESRIA